MTICQAMKEIEERPMTAWMAWGILNYGNEYVIVGGRHINNFPDAKYVYKRVGESFPTAPLYTFEREIENKPKKVW